MLLANLLLAAVTYLSPVHFEVSLAGNFGEPRPNHFHGGIDIKTQQEEGKAVYSIGDGFVSRVSVDVGGMGNAVYVQHPEGYTSVYAHLQRFAPQLEAIVRKWQYRHQTTDLDIKLDATDFPVAQGQLIALSGDTGASMGPHLHLEIHQTDNWNMLDPLDFLPELLEDSIAPKAHSLMAYPIQGEGSFCGEGHQQKFDFMGFSIADSLTAWGKVGFGLYAEDFMQGSYNKYGVRNTVMLVDGKEVFRSEVDDIPVECNKMVNVWGDYDYFVKNQQWFLRSYLLPGCKLPFIKTDDSKGVVDFCEQRDYMITYVLSDFFGNSSRYSFVVAAKPDSIPIVQPDDSLVLKTDGDNSCKTEGLEVYVPSGALLDEAKVNPVALRAGRKKLSNNYLLANKSIPLCKKAKIRVKLAGEVEDEQKLFIAARKRDKKNELDPDQDRILFVDAGLKDGWVEGEISDLGDLFSVDYDDVPPVIKPVNSREWANEPLLVFDVKDEKSGVKTFMGFLDDDFIVFDHVKKSSKVLCDLRNTPVAPTGKERQLRLLARDHKGNESVFDTTINY